MPTARLRTAAAVAGVAAALLTVPTAEAAPATEAGHGRHQLVWKATTPQLRGAGHVGTTLTLTFAPPSGFHPKAASLTYQWLRHGDVIPGATGTVYRLTDADYGRKICVRVTGHKPGWTNGVVRSITVKVAT